MAQAGGSRRAMNDYAPSQLDSAPWVNVQTFGWQSVDSDRRPQNLNGWAPQSGPISTPHFSAVTAPMASHFADHRTRRYGISRANQLGLRSMLSFPGHNQDSADSAQSFGRPNQPSLGPRGIHPTILNTPQRSHPHQNIHSSVSTGTNTNNVYAWRLPLEPQANQLVVPSLSSTLNSNTPQPSNPPGGSSASKSVWKHRHTRPRQGAQSAEASQHQVVQQPMQNRQPSQVPWPRSRKISQVHLSVNTQAQSPPQMATASYQVPQSGPEWTPSLRDHRMSFWGRDDPTIDLPHPWPQSFTPAASPHWNIGSLEAHFTWDNDTSSLRVLEDPLVDSPVSIRAGNSSDDNADERGPRLDQWPIPPRPLESFAPTVFPFLAIQRHPSPDHISRQQPRLPCSICFDTPDHFPALPTTSCTHTATVCTSCLEQHISHAVLSQGSTSLTCPEPDCRKPMEYDDVVKGTKNNKVCLDRYEKLLLRRALKEDPNFVWCKNPACNWGQVHEGGAVVPIVTCQVCNALSCFVHDIPWHIGLTWEQYTACQTQKMEQDQASQDYIDKHAKTCPNKSCGCRIEKTDGCDHMTISRPAGCGHEFCWVCLAGYDLICWEGNHHHNSSCKHYAPIKPPRSILQYSGRSYNDLFV